MKSGLIRRSIVLGILCLLVGVSFITCIEGCCSVKASVDNVENVFLSREIPPPVTYSTNNDYLFSPEINGIVYSEDIPFEVYWNTTFGEINYDFEYLAQQTIDLGHIISGDTDLPYVTVEGLQQPAIDLIMGVSTDGMTWSHTASVYYGDTMYFGLHVTNSGGVDLNDVVVTTPNFGSEYFLYNDDASPPPDEITEYEFEWNLGGLPVGHSVMIVYSITSYFPSFDDDFEIDVPAYAVAYDDSTIICGDEDFVHLIFKETLASIDFVKEVSADGVTWSHNAMVYFSDPVAFRLTVTNTGDVDFSYVQVMDVFPPEFLIFASFPYIVSPDGYLEWNISWGLPAGESFQIIFVANASFAIGEFELPGGAIGYIYPYPYPLAGDIDTVSVIIHPPPLPDISVLKEVSADGITYSDSGVTVYKTKPVYFRMTVTNIGNTDLSDVVVSDIIPSFLTYNGDANPPPDSISGHVIDWDLGTFTEGDMLVITYSANASAVGDGDNTVDASGLFRTTLVSDTDIAHIIVENIPPVANFSYNPLDPTDLDMIQFTDASYDLAGSIVNWTWSFGDGTISYQQHPIYQYSDDGTYTVTLRVTDDDDAYDELSKQVVVLNVPPVADLGGPYSGTTDYPLIVFDGSGSYDLDGSIIMYDWDFGDGNTGAGEKINHYYTHSGNYTVTLTVTDDDGDTDTANTSVKISIDPPTVDLIYPKDGEIIKDTITIQWSALDSKDGENVDIYIYYSDDSGKLWTRLHDGSLENTGEYSWDTTAFTDGLYRLLVEAVDSNDEIGYDSSRFQIKNHEEPPENLPPNKPSKPSGPSKGKAGEEYTYSSSTSDPDGDQVYYMWDWGNGETSGWLGPYNSGETVSATYSWDEKDDYQIKVKAKDISGGESVWSDPLGVSMPKNKLFIYTFLERLIAKFPLFERVISKLIGLIRLL